MSNKRQSYSIQLLIVTSSVLMLLSAGCTDKESVTPVTLIDESDLSDMHWYVQNPLKHDCSAISGPDALMKNFEKYGTPYKVIHQKKIKGILVEITLEIPNQIRPAVYIRGQKRCMDNMNEMIRKRLQHQSTNP